MSAAGVRRPPPIGFTWPQALARLLTVVSLGASPQAESVKQQIGNAYDHLRSAAWSRSGGRRERFAGLARRWREETVWLSSVTEIAMHPSYQAIIGMGPDALPLIIDELRERQGYWYWALKAISGEDPIPPCDRGSVSRMRDGWLRWAAERGLVEQ
ncbi:MAG: hypothetical protein IPM64_16345 [Phycisphaerales bacterium]|nr:hypothetical protein [Phycisphaerales bacterium]